MLFRSDHLPAAEFALNSRLSAGAKHTPFELIYGYRPDFTLVAGKRSSVPAADQRLAELARARADAQAALRLTKQRMKEQYERDKKTAHEFQPGDFVGLSSKDITIHQ